MTEEKTGEQGDPKDREVTVDQAEQPPSGKDPTFVVLNTNVAGMWDDRARSGLYLRQWPEIVDGVPQRRDFARVPPDRDLSGLRRALQVGILLSCNVSGQNNALPKPLVKADTVAELMSGKRQIELMSIIDQITDLRLLQNMLDYESGRAPKQRRDAIVSCLRDRMKSPDIAGATSVRTEQAMVWSREKQAMVPDNIDIR